MKYYWKLQRFYPILDKDYLLGFTVFPSGENINIIVEIFFCLLVERHAQGPRVWLKLTRLMQNRYGLSSL